MSTSIKRGDCLLYRPTSIWGLIISIKTWSDVSHVEAYIGNGMSIAARSDGVRIYPTRFDDIAYVLRPIAPFDIEKANQAFMLKFGGQGYDWLGLLRFTWRKKYISNKITDNKQFCSELLTRWYREGGLDPFNNVDADTIAPWMFKLSDKFKLAG